MKLTRVATGFMSAMLLSGGVLWADDVSSLKSEVADLKAKVAAMESTQMAPAASGDAEALTSMKKKGAIKIGGKVEMFTQVLSRDDRAAYDNTGTNGAVAATNTVAAKGDEVQSTTFMASNADLKFDIAATKDMGAIMYLAFYDFWDQAVAQDDLLEECYFYFKNIRGSAFGVNFGKKEAPFGQDKDPIINTPYSNNGSRQSFLGRAWEAADASAANSNRHTTVGDFSHPGELDRVFMIEGNWKYKDVIKAEAAVFQSTASGGAANTIRTGGGAQGTSAGPSGASQR